MLCSYIVWGLFGFLCFFCKLDDLVFLMLTNSIICTHSEFPVSLINKRETKEINNNTSVYLPQNSSCVFPVVKVLLVVHVQ